MTVPDKYVDIQREYNTFHSGQRLETYGDMQAEFVVRCVEKLAKHGLADEDELSFLDVGCRMGHGINKWLEVGMDGESLGVDIVPEFVEYAREKFPDGKFQIADMHDLPWAHGKWDIVMCSQTLEHAHDVDKAVEELIKCAKVALYISIPLEPAEMKEVNPSHYVFDEDPVAWISRFRQCKLLWAEKVGHYFDFMVLK